MNPETTVQTTHRCAFGVADFNLEIHCNQVRLTEILRKRYADFPAGVGAAFRAEIEWVGKVRSSSLLDTQTRFQDGILRFCAPGYEGWIDPRTQQGNLQLSSAYPVEDIDYFLRVALALMVHQAGGILLHTAGIVRDGQAQLFFGHSGAGKSTVCQVSMDTPADDSAAPADGYTVLNDDLILARPEQGTWWAYGTPFWNPTQVRPTNQKAPIAGMYLLVQDTRVYTQPLSAGKATAALIANVPVIPQDPLRSVQLLAQLAQFQQQIPIHELHFLPDNSFWHVIPA